MNFLAHMFLAGDEEELIVGNFIADSVKGNHYKNYAPRVMQGILMHRATDYFSDTHPTYLKSVHRLAPKHGKFSGVITDMLYDYLLASSWNEFSDTDLEEFTKKTYAILLAHQSAMPEKSRIILHYMSKHNWLLSYKELNGIERALKGLSERMKYYHPMNEAVKEFNADIHLYQQDFNEFFPLVREHVKPYLRDKE
ncbi:MAG TPA: ACP phosphodiesterase [Bacteroidia bacterium]|jgi:acyl carrier protein phosphodiesterase|nr:ACP phosphodiesterase [Bacteroidia bacterium]